METLEPGFRLGIDPTLFAFVAGAALLFFGRRLYFLLLAVAGFAIGFFLAGQLGIDASFGPDWLSADWVIAALFGIGLGFLALVLQRVVLAIAGFLLGALATVWVLDLWLDQAGPIGWLVVLAGGIVAALLMPTLFEAALVLLSSVIGARLLVEGLGNVGLDARWVPWTFLGLVVVGLLVQWRSGDDERPRRTRRKRRRRDDDYDD